MSLDESDKPEEPSEDDCCHNSCTFCVFDIYRKQLELWEKNKWDNTARCDILSQTHFQPFMLKEVNSLTSDTNLYKFQPLDKDVIGVLPYKSGQHLILKLDDDRIANSKIITRAYTIVTKKNEKENCSFQVLIKIYNNGMMSKYLQKIQIGDVTYWRGPYGDYVYHSNMFRNILMICMGTGIAPMYAIIQEIIDNEDDETMVTLMYGCRSCKDIILREELLRLSTYWNFNYTCYLSQNFSRNDKKYSEKFCFGKISEESIKSCINFPVETSQILICGTLSFSNEVFQNLLNCNVPKENIHVF